MYTRVKLYLTHYLNTRPEAVSLHRQVLTVQDCRNRLNVLAFLQV